MTGRERVETTTKEVNKDCIVVTLQEFIYIRYPIKGKETCELGTTIISQSTEIHGRCIIVKGLITEIGLIQRT